uniref:Uncharacterized protein n=1 Tax=Anopheles melas TaxID=34690 RepID=A0A182TD13_9DIPT
MNGRGGCGLLDHGSRLLSRQPGDATPTSAIYQRMHSNDSGKSSDKENSHAPSVAHHPGLGAAGGGSTGSLNGPGAGAPAPTAPHHPPRSYSSQLAQLYRKSASPARQGPTGGSAGARGAARYATKPARGVPGGMNSLPRPLHHTARPSTAELRRSSAAGLNVVSQRPPLPPKIELRSHSYDGLLDDTARLQRGKAGSREGAGVKKATEGNDEDRVDGHRETPIAEDQQDQEEPIKVASQIRKLFAEPASGGGGGGGGGGGVGSSAGSESSSIKSKNRRSRSMDDLFDDEQAAGPDCNFLDSTQSMETLLEPVSADKQPDTPPPVACSMGGNICLNRRFVPPEEEQTVAPELSRPTSQEQLCEKETITVDSTPRFQGGPPGPSQRDDDLMPELPDEEDVQSTHSSVTSSASGGPKKTPKPLINRYVKKVKSFMKM